MSLDGVVCDVSDFGRIELVPVSRVQPSTYNPRKADEARLNLVELSLRKLGRLLPIFATPEGEILSGHQRHFVACRMGATHVPVVFTKSYDENRRRSLNIVFNRATNDLNQSEGSQEVTEKLRAASELESLAESIPDKVVNSPEWFACMTTAAVDIAKPLSANRGAWINYARNTASWLLAEGLWMPIVFDPDDLVVNGIGRLMWYAEKEYKTVPAVRIAGDEARFARLMLNYLTMDFDIHTRYADILRHNSFRRARGQKDSVGTAFKFDAFGGKSVGNASVQIDKSPDKEKWIRHYGRSVVDFGAGLLIETNLLNSIGVECTPFEPYQLTPGTEKIDRERSVATARAFLEKVASGTRWDSVFISSVFNSVPFQADRDHIITILAALCGPKTKVHAATVNVNANMIQNSFGNRVRMSEHAATNKSFSLSYEPGTVLSDYSRMPKMQRGFDMPEWHEMWSRRFCNVKAKPTNELVLAVSSVPKPLDPHALAAALRFEFDLPYPGGERMGLVDEAIAAFSERHGVNLAQF